MFRVLLARNLRLCGYRSLAARLAFWGFWLVGAGVCWGIHPHVPFVEVVHRADVIYAGAVSKVTSRPGPASGTIVTDVTFQVTDLIHEKPTALRVAGGEVTLTFAGGQLGDHGQSVSGVPTFQVGEQYVVFSRLDGGSYINPLIGGTQGLFRIHRTPDGRRYPLTLGDRGVTGRTDGELRFSAEVETIGADGVRFVSTRQASPPSPAGGADPQRDGARPGEADTAAPLLRLDEFIEEIRAVLHSPPPTVPALRGMGDTPDVSPESPQRSKRAGGQGANPQRPGPFAPMEPLRPLEQLPPQDPARPTGRGENSTTGATLNASIPGLPGAVAEPEEDLALLCYCGYADLFLTMEQVPTDWWEWWEHNNAMFYYNQYMDIYRFVADDGSWGNNGESEFGGYPSSADLIGQYGAGAGWNGEIAVTWTSWSGCQCCEITQADVFFNPAYSFWQNFADTLDQSGRVLYRPIVMHELGHSWGMQRGSCTEDYSYGQVSVMHAYYFDVVEDGFGLHHVEAWAIRELYDDQTGITGFTDIGVESYYASGSLINSTTDSSVYYGGDGITLNNITVENNSNAAVAGLRVRFFLSTDQALNAGDTQMGSYWYWDSFGAENYSTASYSTTVPNVPAGTYYVLAVVTRNGDAYTGDDFSPNDVTFLHDRIAVIYPQPSNDFCSLGPALPLGTTFGTTHGAFADGSASCGVSQTTPDVWYTFDAPCDGTVQFDTFGSAYDTVLSAHSHCIGLTSNELACNDDCVGTTSCVYVPVSSPGLTRVRVSGYDGAVGDFHLSAGYLAPGNDMCQNAAPILEGQYSLATCGATTDGPDEPSACHFASDSQVSSDVWFCYIPSCPYAVIADVCGASYDTKLAVYDGCQCPSTPSAVACNDDDCDLQSRVVFRSSLETGHLIRVGGYLGDAGDGTLTLRCGGSADFDGDRDVDLSDAAAFVNCYWQNGENSCGPFYLAGSPLIDANDWAAFLPVFYGP